MFWPFKKDIVKRDAYSFFEANRENLLVGSLDEKEIANNAYQAVYDYANKYCVERNLHLNTIHKIRSHFKKWSEDEINEGISIVM